MNKISVYVDNMFASLPKTQQAQDMRRYMIESMEEKYAALLAQGKNENEAFGIVAGDFGSVEEIRAELGQEDVVEDNAHQYAIEILEEYRQFRQKFSIAMAAGVASSILAFVAAILLDHFYPSSDIAGIVWLLLSGVAAIIFVYWGLQNSKYGKIPDLVSTETGKKGNGELYNRISGFVMFGAVALFFIAGGLFRAWHPAWVVFPVAAVICGVLENIGRGK